VFVAQVNGDEIKNILNGKAHPEENLTYGHKMLTLLHPQI
jgi:hypothetical protein